MAVRGRSATGFLTAWTCSTFPLRSASREVSCKRDALKNRNNYLLVWWNLMSINVGVSFIEYILRYPQDEIGLTLKLFNMRKLSGTSMRTCQCTSVLRCLETHGINIHRVSPHSLWCSANRSQYLQIQVYVDTLSILPSSVLNDDAQIRKITLRNWLNHC